MTYEAERQAQKRARARNRDPAKMWLTILAPPILIGCAAVLYFLRGQGILSWVVALIGALMLFPIGGVLSEWYQRPLNSLLYGMFKSVVVVMGGMFVIVGYLLFAALHLLAGP